MGEPPMKTTYLFGLLVTFQAAHSIEEVTFGLYDWLPFFRWMDSVETGGSAFVFVVVNIGIVVFGYWCYFARVRPGHPSSRFLITLWVTIEILNGIGHPTWSALVRSYVPGTATAPLLLITSLLLIWTINRQPYRAGAIRPPRNTGQ